MKQAKMPATAPGPAPAGRSDCRLHLIDMADYSEQASSTLCCWSRHILHLRALWTAAIKTPGYIPNSNLLYISNTTEL